MPKIFKRDLLSDSVEEESRPTLYTQHSTSIDPSTIESLVPESSHASGDMSTMLQTQHFDSSAVQPQENTEPHHESEVVPHEGFPNFADLASVDIVEGGSRKVVNEASEAEGIQNEQPELKTESMHNEADPADEPNDSMSSWKEGSGLQVARINNDDEKHEEIHQAVGHEQTEMDETHQKDLEDESSDIEHEVEPIRSHESKPVEEEDHQEQANKADFFQHSETQEVEKSQMSESDHEKEAPQEELVRGHVHNRGLHSDEIGASVPFLNPSHEIESPLDTPELPQAHTAEIASEPSVHSLVEENRIIESYPLPHHDSQTPEPMAHNSQQYRQEISQESFPQEDFHHEDMDPVKTLITWNAVSRPFRKKNRSFYTTVAIIIILLSLIAVLAGEFMLVGVLFALGFLVYVLNFIPPEEISYKISTQGVTISDHFYHWQQLNSFWFSEKDGFRILNILTQIRFPGVLLIVLGDKSEDEVRSVVAKYLPFHEIAPKTMFEKWADSLQKHFPLENPHR